MSETLGYAPLFFFILFYSAIIHECSHAIAARVMGDPTAYLMGRITLNPIRHIDVVWTIIMPLVTYFGSRGTFIFGGAKPVPINPYNFRNPDKGMMISSLAGPVSNFILAFLGFIAFFLTAKVLPLSGFFLDFNEKVFSWLIIINILLGVFNLIPIPPLDGSRVLRYFLPWKLKETFDSVEPYGMIIVFVFVMAGGTAFISVILGFVIRILDYLLRL